MNLQTMSIILIIIVLPITLILTAYTKIQIDTIALQTQYRTKLSDATYDAISAFQINTVNNNFSTVSDSMRRDVAAVVQTFISTLATNLGMSGTDEINIKPYIPAIAFTLYDGFYIYSPSVSHKVDGSTTTTTTSEQTETTSYEHVLKPYIYYTARYKNETHKVDVVVNYTLDNYIVVTGQLGENNYVTKAGYLIDVNNVPDIEQEETLVRDLPVTTIAYVDNPDNKNYIGTPVKINTETAQMVVSSGVAMGTDRYSNGGLLKDENVFPNYENLYVNNINEAYRTSTGTININREMLKEELEKAKDGKFSSGALLKKWYSHDSNNDGIAGDETYKTTASSYNLGYYVEPNTNSYYIPANSAWEFYYGAGGAVEFSNWVNNSLLQYIKASDAIKSDGKYYENFSNEFIFKTGAANDPTDAGSAFSDHRRNIIKESIQDNLSQAIASYNENSEGLNTVANFQMPKLSENEWDQVLKNVCLITFMQGIQVGTKVFNDYAIVTSTTNKEYVSEDSIYYVNVYEEDDGTTKYYHKIDCPALSDELPIVGYRNSDFERMSYELEDKVSLIETENNEARTVKDIQYADKTYYYYMHSELACYECIVNSTAEKYDIWDMREPTKFANRRKAYYTALAREKYNFYKTNEYFDFEQQQ